MKHVLSSREVALIFDARELERFGTSSHNIKSKKPKKWAKKWLRKHLPNNSAEIEKRVIGEFYQIIIRIHPSRLEYKK